MNKNKNKAFTILELLIVVAILGILVLLAIPKFIGYADKAQVTQIKNDVKVGEEEISKHILEYGNLDDFGIYTIPDGTKVYDKRGEITNKIEGELVDITDIVDSNLNGIFLSDKEGKVYYVDKKKLEEWHYYGQSEIWKGRETILSQIGHITPKRVSFYDGHKGKDGVLENTGITIQINADDYGNYEENFKSGMAGIGENLSYGTYESKLKAPEQPGLLTGFFLYGEESNGDYYEMDIELLKENQIWQLWLTVHNEQHEDYVLGGYMENYNPEVDYAEPGVIYQKKINLNELGVDPTASYNNYKIIYDKDFIAFELNDSEVGRWNNSFKYDKFALHASSFWANWLQSQKNDYSWYEEVNFEWVRKKNE